jgi:hypothetical protein
MYSQFFGNFLLNNHIINPDQLLEVLSEQTGERLKLGTLAMDAGYMTADEVDSIVIMQTHEDKMFGELAVEMGYLTPEQVEDLVSRQVPDYLALGEKLVERGLVTNQEFENLLLRYQSENELYNLENTSGQRENVLHIIMNFCQVSREAFPEESINFLNLFFNNLIRFIGDDFTVLDLKRVSEYKGLHSVMQNIEGASSFSALLDMDEDVALKFASRYAHEDFEEHSDAAEYVAASLEDFLNLHNGLFLVNTAAKTEQDLTLLPPETEHDYTYRFDDIAFALPILYPFGMLHFVFQSKSNA